MVVQNIATLKGKTPHLVIMKCTRFVFLSEVLVHYSFIWTNQKYLSISRATVDVNREIKEAAQACANAETAWSNYHGRIQSIYSTFTQGKALLIDIHGQVSLQRFS